MNRDRRWVVELAVLAFFIVAIFAACQRSFSTPDAPAPYDPSRVSTYNGGEGPGY